MRLCWSDLFCVIKNLKYVDVREIVWRASSVWLLIINLHELIYKFIRDKCTLTRLISPLLRVLLPSRDIILISSHLSARWNISYYILYFVRGYLTRLNKIIWVLAGILKSCRGRFHAVSTRKRDSRPNEKGVCVPLSHCRQQERILTTASENLGKYDGKGTREGRRREKERGRERKKEEEGGGRISAASS